jgi:hypothetical protein
MPSLERNTPHRRAARLRGTFLLGVLLAALVPAAADCGGDDDDGVGPGGGFNCADEFGARCSTPCTNDPACGAGLFCSNGACTAQCSGDRGCGGGQSCSTQGRCVGVGTGGSGGAGGSGLPPNMGSGGAGGGVSGAGGSGNCPDVTAKFTQIIPAVMLVIDRSASMNCYGTDEAEIQPDCPTHTNPNDAQSRWQLLKGPLLNVTRNLEKSVIFGATFYTTGGQCAVELNAEKFRIENADEFKALYDSLQPEGNTPTSQAIEAATATTNSPASELPPNTPKFMILATDGSPNCAAQGEDAQDEAVGAIGAAFASGVPTFVVAIGALFEGDSQIEQERRARFQEMADAGAGKAEAPIYFASDSTKLEAALTGIINGVRPCSFDLDVALDNPEADGPKGVVTIGTSPIPFNDPNGWQLTDNNTITFVGTACTSIQNGATDVKASFPCGVETTPVPPPPPPPR